MFYLLNKKLSFEVNVTACGCGMNSALYFISMESDGGQASSGYTGATYGTGYCDAAASSTRPSFLRRVGQLGGQQFDQCLHDASLFKRPALAALVRSLWLWIQHLRSRGYEFLRPWTGSSGGQHSKVHGRHPIRHRRRN